MARRFDGALKIGEPHLALRVEHRDLRLLAMFENESTILSNIHSKLDAIERKEANREGDLDDDIPF